MTELYVERKEKCKGGHYLVVWSVVTQPKELGRLGIADLKTLGSTLRVRWMWLQKTEPDKP
jgi:hypothetical protein